MNNEATEAQPIVFVVDDDESLRESLGSLLRSVGLQVVLHASADEFLSAGRPDTPSCLILDVRLPGLSGLDFQDQLTNGGVEIPIVFMTGHGDIPMTVKAMKGGAVEFLTKPFRDQDLLDRIREALMTDKERRQQQEQHAEVEKRVARLTNREHEVFDLVVTGKPNKVIAYELGVSQRTVEIHRARVMEKMQARSLADLVRMHMTE